MTKILHKLGTEGNYLNIKVIYEKSISNILLYSEKLKAFPLRSRTRQECPLLPLPLNTVEERLFPEMTDVGPSR